jgi:hypothetical protein
MKETLLSEFKDKPEQFETTPKTEVITLTEAVELARDLPAMKRNSRGLLKSLRKKLNNWLKRREGKQCGKCLELGAKVFNH